MSVQRALASTLAGVATSSIVFAATLQNLDIDRRRGRYELVASAHLDATPASIYAVLMDYDDNAYRHISGAYKESRYLAPDDDGTPVVYTRMEGCFLFHCVSLRRVERLETEKPYHIRSFTVPERSNFKYSTSEWELMPDGMGGTDMTYTLEMEPDFWVPPIIGPWYLKRVLSRGGAHAVMRIERLARVRDGRPVPPRAVSAAAH